MHKKEGWFYKIYRMRIHLLNFFIRTDIWKKFTYKIIKLASNFMYFIISITIMFICTVCSDFIYLAYPQVLIERLYISGFLIHIHYWICTNTISIADNNFRPIRIILLRGRKMRCSCRFILFSYWATFHGFKYGFRDLSKNMLGIACSFL